MSDVRRFFRQGAIGLLGLGLVAAFAWQRGRRETAVPHAPRREAELLSRKPEVPPGPPVVSASGALRRLGDGARATPDVLRGLLASGTQAERVAALAWMLAQDRKAGTRTYEVDVVRAINSPDLVVCMAAAESVLGYYAEGPDGVRYPADLAARALAYYRDHGNPSVRLPTVPDPEVHGVSAFGVGVDLLRRFGGVDAIRAAEGVADDLAARGDSASALQILLALAEKGNSKGVNLTLNTIRSGDRDLLSDAAQILCLAGSAGQVPALQDAYGALSDGSAAKEHVLNAIAKLDPARAKPFLIEQLPREREKARRQDMRRLLKLGGTGDEGLREALSSRALRPDGHVDVEVASALAEMGDQRLLPKLRNEVPQAVAATTPEAQAYASSAIRLLVLMKDRPSVDALGKLLFEARGPIVREEAHKGLVAMGTPEAQSWLDAYSKR